MHTYMHMHAHIYTHVPVYTLFKSVILYQYRVVMVISVIFSVVGYDSCMITTTTVGWKVGISLF